MKLFNAKSGREVKVGRCKGDKLAKWCSAVKPVTIKVDGAPVKMYASESKSDYIYLDGIQGDTQRFHYIWKKDQPSYHFTEVLTEKSLVVTKPMRGIKSEVAEVTEALQGAPEPTKAKRAVKVIKKTAQVQA